MTAETILTDDAIARILSKKYGYPVDEVFSADHSAARAIEQAVLQSELVQAWKRDSELMGAMVEKRIAVTPEYEGGWHAEIFVDQVSPIATGYRSCPRAAIDVAMEQQT